MSGHPILMLVHSYCPADPRVRREAEALVEAGHSVDVFCLRDRGQASREIVGGVRYVRFPIRRRRGGVLRYAYEYLALLALSAIVAMVLQPIRRYRIVQAHNMPDVLVFGGIFPWLCGAPLLLDLHDPVPELYRSKFGLESDAPLIRMLTMLEGLSIACADRVIVATGAFRERLLERRRPAERITVLLNSPDRKLFRPQGEPTSSDVPIVLFHGTVTERSGVDLLVRAASEVRSRGRDLRLVILGDGDFLPDVRRLAGEGDRPEWVEARGPVSLDRIPGEVERAQIGVVPNRAGVFHDLALPTRIFEYLSMRRPVIVSRSPAISDLFEDEDLLFFDPGDEEGLARVLGEALADPDRRAACVRQGTAVAELHRWDREKEIYLEVVESLLDPSFDRNQR